MAGEGAGVGGGVGARRAADGGLIDLDGLVDLVDADHGAVLAGIFARAVELPGKRAIEDVVDERRLARAGDPGDDRHDAEGEVRGDVLEIVGAGVFPGDPGAGERAWAGFAGGVGRPRKQGGGAREVLAGDGGGVRHDLGWGAVGDEVAAVFAGAGAEV